MRYNGKAFNGNKAGHEFRGVPGGGAKKLLGLAILVAVPTLLPAQTATQLADAAETITEQNIARHIGVIAHDSMGTRDTPSRGLASTAQYIAGQFQNVGLKWAKINAYPIPGKIQLDYSQTRILFGLDSETGERTWHQIPFATAARFAVDSISEYDVTSRPETRNRVVVMVGPHTPETVSQIDLRRHIIIYIAPPATDSSIRRQIIETLRHFNNVIILSEEDSATFAARRDAALRDPVVVVNKFMTQEVNTRGWAVYMWPQAIEAYLRMDGVDLGQARTASTPAIWKLPKASLQFDLKTASNRTQRKNTNLSKAGLNVVGVLNGTDPTLRKKSIFLVAHMDHIGEVQSDTGHHFTGTDDNASGVAGLIELAKAFSRPGVRPRRDITFLAVSGSAKDFWGMNYETQKRSFMYDALIGINLDMTGREARDSIRVDGLTDIDFSVRPEWVALQHPELRLTLVDAGSAVNRKSDHAVWVRDAIPALYFYNNTHKRTRTGDTPADIDADQEARALRLIFYIVHEIANAKQPPQWTSKGRQRWGQRVTP